jgi:hypothetical protein
MRRILRTLVQVIHGLMWGTLHPPRFDALVELGTAQQGERCAVMLNEWKPQTMLCTYVSSATSSALLVRVGLSFRSPHP